VTVPEHVSIAYRGANYAIGQGPQFYGIWYAASPQAQPLEWWPLTPDGWTAAWMRFASIEVPGTITPVTATQPATPTASVARTEPARATKRAGTAAALVAVGIALGVIGLFPTYVGGASLASQPSNLVPHVIYLAAWGVSAALILLSGTWRKAGALLGLGVSAVTFGFFFADAGTPLAGGAHLMGSGLILGILGWLACTAGVATAFPASGLSLAMPRRRRAPGHPTRPSAHDIVPMVTIILAAVGAAIAFAPSWDSFVLRTAAGASQTVTLGNAFANPAPVIVGDVAVMVALVAVAVVAAFWRPLRLGSALVVGAIIPMAAQAISAIVQLSAATSPLQFGISPAQASGLGLTISSGLTPMFWVYCAFLATLILLCVWMLLAAEGAIEQTAAYPGQPQAGTPASGGPSQPMQASLAGHTDAPVTGSGAESRLG
jgi:uncharacterized membrane protein YagU involved in acid resistance